jgi:hypothetical protein
LFAAQNVAVRLRADRRGQERAADFFFPTFQLCVGVVAEINKFRSHNGSVVTPARRRFLRAAFNFNISLSTAAARFPAEANVNFFFLPRLSLSLSLSLLSSVSPVTLFCRSNAASS